MKHFILGFAAIPLFLAACSQASEPSETEATPAADGPVLSYTDAFIMAPIGGRDVTMGGIEITANGGDVRLTGATSEVASSVETHTMSMDEGTMKMRPVDGWDIGDGETLDLDRGGDHLMFFGLEPGLAAGDVANVTLYFDVDGRDEPLTLEAEAEVRAVGE
ncbi:copper chaperone PCu(A)C [Henriciella sp. AS95]|uniref:copper chaperone PCu(A)C n=1 Tax=Henriciella sp. AS95 TaxID=3135782 RepID=UPI0031704987